MPNCFSFNPASPEASPGDDPLPSPSLGGGGVSSTFNLNRELAHAFQTPSHHDRRSRLLAIDPTPENLELFLSQELKPNKECVQEALRHAKQTTLTQLVSTYFQHSENATRFCLNLYQNVHSARCHLYTPLSQLFHVLPGDAAIDQSFCNLACDVFHKLDTFENPFSSPESHSSQDTKLCLSQLKHNVDRRLCKSKSRLRLLHHATAGSALCLVTAVFAVAASAAVIAYHALPTLVVVVAGPLCTPYLPHSFKKKELTNISQLNVASKGTFVLNKDLDTIDSLVYRLHTAIKNDKLLIRLGLERGRDVFLIQGFLKQLHKSHVNHTHQLEVLVDHICSWFTYVNQSRSSLLKELHLPPRTHGNL